MTTQPRKAHVWLRFAKYVGLSVLFAIIYTQSPLYTSNQNLYFLQGLAKSGFGYLNEDWLANTPDPMPVFTALVNLTFSLTQLKALFYIYYAALMGIYLVSIFSIVASVHPLPPLAEKSRQAASILFLSLFFLVHSAAWRFAVSRTLGDNWTYILEDGVADQRLLGPVFQPSAFGVLLILSIALFLKKRPKWAALSAALAALFHPTYLLSAALLVASYILVDAAQYKSQPGNPNRIKTLEARALINLVLPGFLALIVVSPILVYVYLNFSQSSAEVAAKAQEILVNYRLPHHAIPSWWFDITAIVKLAIIGLAAYLVRKTRLFWILSLASLSAGALTLAQVISGSTALALIFPWRISILLVPLSTCIILWRLVCWVFQRLEMLSDHHREQLHKGVYLASFALITILAVIGGIRLILDFDRQAQYNDRPIMEYVSAHHATGDLYLIPIKMQDFRLVTGSAAFVDFKSHPYQNDDVIEWYQRIQLASEFYKNLDCDLLLDVKSNERLTHIIIPTDQTTPACFDLNPIYQDPAYSLYVLP